MRSKSQPMGYCECEPVRYGIKRCPDCDRLVWPGAKLRNLDQHGCERPSTTIRHPAEFDPPDTVNPDDY